VHSVTFAQRWNRLTTHFSENIPVVKRRMTVFCFVCPSVCIFELEELLDQFLLNLTSVVIETSLRFSWTLYRIMFSYDRIRIHVLTLARIAPYLSCFIIDVLSMYSLTGLTCGPADGFTPTCVWVSCLWTEAITSGFVVLMSSITKTWQPYESYSC
jgi:hypothetical protein